jgi:hypothetical protein
MPRTEYVGDAYGGVFLPPSPADLAIGQLHHDARTIIRDLICLEGFEAARERIANYLIDELNRSQNRG